MRKLNLGIFLGILLTLFAACKDEDLAPIATFDSAEKGAYVRLINQTNGNVNLFDIENSAIEYTVEFVDLEKGQLVSEYRLQVSYEDNNPENGDNSTGPVEFQTWTSADFTVNQNGFVGLESIKITAMEAISSLGLNATDILSSDRFRFSGSLTTTSGQTFTRENSSAAVNGASFRGFFDFSMNAFCPSNLEGTYQYQTAAASVTCARNGTIDTDLSGEITIIALGDGVYNMSDWSFGAYTACGGSETVADSPGLQFTETCQEIAFTGNVDRFGDTWSFVSFVDGNEWTIQWENTFGEKGETVLINENGWGIAIEE